MTEAGGDPTNDLGRGNLSLGRRVELLERDREQQSRAITELVETVQKGFTPAQLDQIRAVFLDAQADAGLRLDDASHQDEAREDYRFLRRLRKRWDGAAHMIGNSVLVAVVAIAGAIIATGFWAWINSGGKPPA